MSSDEADGRQERPVEATVVLEPMVAPDGPWRAWWQGSGPERGSHVMDGRRRIAYLPAAEGTDGVHAEAQRIVYEHNCAVEMLMKHNTQVQP